MTALLTVHGLLEVDGVVCNGVIGMLSDRHQHDHRGGLADSCVNRGGWIRSPVDMHQWFTIVARAVSPGLDEVGGFVDLGIRNHRLTSWNIRSPQDCMDRRDGLRLYPPPLPQWS